MCLSAAIGYLIWEGHQQRKAAKTAERKTRAAMAASAAAERSEKNVTEAEEAAEAQAPDVETATDLSVAKRRRGVTGTYLSQTLGD